MGKSSENLPKLVEKHMLSCPDGKANLMEENRNIRSSKLITVVELLGKQMDRKYFKYSKIKMY